MPTLTHLLLHTYSNTPTLTRLQAAAEKVAEKAAADAKVPILHVYSYTPTLTRPLFTPTLAHLLAYTYTHPLTRLLLHAYSYMPARTRLSSIHLLLHVYSYNPTLTRLL
jgi:hypothetical protein